MQNSDMKFEPQRGEVTGPTKLHDEGGGSKITGAYPGFFIGAVVGLAVWLYVTFFGN
jgi:hypothetical protein